MRIAIVDDRPLAAEAVRRVVAAAPGYAVAWVARDGAEAVQKAVADPPDLILMDLVMPGVNGAEATRRIMTTRPVPILVVTGSVSGNFGLVYEALGAGAVDAVNTPVLGPDGSLAGGDVLLAKVAQIAKKATTGSAPDQVPAARPAPHLVAIGSSTGGPAAVADLLAGLGPAFPGAVVLTQHIGADFTAGLAEWVQHKTRFPVRVAKSGDCPQPGVALLAGRDDHLVMTADGTLAYTPDPVDTPFRPNVDALFVSLAAHWPHPGSAAVLTGMGRDGADGLLRLRRAGWTTYAQTAGSCAVPSMPDAAVKLGAAGHVLTPAEIGRAIAAGKRVA